MIPKIIHYCWFGRKEKPKLVKKCIASWKKYCPDFTIIEWNEDNFDVSQNTYTQFTSERNLYAYLSDYARLKAVFDYGGIYFDTDVELIKPIDNLLKYSSFFGFEKSGFVTTGLGFGAVKNHHLVGELMHEYDVLKEDELSSRYNKDHHLTGSPTMNMRVLKRYGLRDVNEVQHLQDALILPEDYFCPYDDVTGELTITSNTYTIHWYGKSAQNWKSKIRSRITRPLHRIQKCWRNLL